MGLFWSLSWKSSKSSQGPPQGSLIYRNRLSVVDDNGNQIVEKVIARQVAVEDPEIIRQDIVERGIVATVFTPKSQTPPAKTVITLSGSEGGKRLGTAAQLARLGFNGVALAYVNPHGQENLFPDLPNQLVEVPLEYFEKAFKVIRNLFPGVHQRIGLLGGSKGGELALLLATRLAEVAAVVAYNPSGIVWSGLGKTDTVACSSWSVEGKGIPFLQGNSCAIAPNQPPRAMRSCYEQPLKNAPPDLVAAASIPVELAHGPLLVISGGDDQMWPSAHFCQLIGERMQVHGRASWCQHLNYQTAGHAIGTGYTPATILASGPFLLGGSPPGNAAAAADSWGKVVRFLKNNLET